MEEATVIIRNKNPQRSHQLNDGRILEPLKTMAVTAAEARQHLNYTDIEDAAMAVPQNAEMIARLQSENAALRAEREKRIQPVLSPHSVTPVEKAIPPSQREGAYAVTVPETLEADGDVSRPQRAKPKARRKAR